MALRPGRIHLLDSRDKDEAFFNLHPPTTLSRSLNSEHRQLRTAWKKHEDYLPPRELLTTPWKPWNGGILLPRGSEKTWSAMQVRVSLPAQASASPNAVSLMLSFSSPENKIGGAETLSQDLAISIRTSSSGSNQTPLKKQETFDLHHSKREFDCEESFVARSRRRLASTTQLMQQIFPPLSSRSLSADAIALHESIVYMSAMLVLTDAWSSSCFLVGSSFSNSIENYSRRLKVLESEFLRLETGYSAVDIRMECHELEKNAMIIRFTRFHECEETERAGWLIETANSEVFQNLFHPAGSEVLPQKLIADCGMLMKLLKGLHILSL